MLTSPDMLVEILCAVRLWFHPDLLPQGSSKLEIVTATERQTFSQDKFALTRAKKHFWMRVWFDSTGSLSFKAKKLEFLYESLWVFTSCVDAWSWSGLNYCYWDIWQIESTTSTAPTTSRFCLGHYYYLFYLFPSNEAAGSCKRSFACLLNTSVFIKIWSGFFKINQLCFVGNFAQCAPNIAFFCALCQKMSRFRWNVKKQAKRVQKFMRLLSLPVRWVWGWKIVEFFWLLSYFGLELFRKC